MLPQFGKVLIVFGLLIVVFGLVLLLVDKIPLIGKLPGDFSFKSGNTRIYIPIATCLILSALLTLILNLIGRWK
ncbi:MAG: DUF2905 domain-containing protein [Candidatus Zixiibacteriota bacterium]|nr:MAG: DUF2905 domain-containing protein [candidate division Zixibacteria bacterium]